MGVDGARGGWIGVRRRGGGTPEVVVAPRWDKLPVADVLCVDMPVGLPDRGRRGCDLAARALLGPRRSSVFLDLRRPLLGFDDYPAALAWAKVDGAGFSKQAWNILPRIAEIDRSITLADQDRVFETHPELVFMRLNGDVPMAHPKRDPVGFLRRYELLREAGFGELNEWLDVLDRNFAAPDDLLDACALCWAAGRIARGEGRRLPEGEPLRDARGLRMEIWF